MNGRYDTAWEIALREERRKARRKRNFLIAVAVIYAAVHIGFFLWVMLQ